MRSRIAWQKVPTPGPYSTNNLVFAQSVRDSMLRISLPDDGMIDPTITGWRRNSLKNIVFGPGPAPYCGLAPRLRACSPVGEFMTTPWAGTVGRATNLQNDDS